MSHCSYESTYDEDMDEMMRRVTETLRLKQQEYARPTNRLANFDEVAEGVGVTPMQAWYTFFYKHVCSVRNYIRDGKTFTEPIEGRVMDLIVYLLLFYKMIKRDQRRAHSAKYDAATGGTINTPNATDTGA